MADYPRQLVLDADVRDELIRYLDSVLGNHEGERGAFLDDLIRYQEDYWAKPLGETRNFPFRGAANIIIPLTAIAFEAVHARTMTTLFGLRQMTSAKSKSDKWAEVAPAFERYMDHELKYSIDFRDKIESALIELQKLGTGVAKSSYEKVVKWAIRNVGDREVEMPVTIRQGATVDSIPLSRFMMPYTSQDPQTAPWCGEEHDMTPTEAQLHENGGLFTEGTVEKIRNWVGSLPNAYEASQETLENREPAWPERLKIYEIWLEFDVDRTGRRKEIVVHYHRDSRTLCSVRYNWHDDLRRPYRSGVYFPVEHRWTGIGIAKQNEQFQREVTTQHRQRLDNATLANMRMIKVSRMSKYGPGEPVFPGKIWVLDDMSHVETFQLGEIYPSAYNNENQTLLYSQQRTGVNEVTLGMPSVGTPGTATGDLARVQEGRKKFDYSYGNIKDFVNEVLMDVACNIHQFGPRNVSYFEEVTDGKLVQQALTLPEDYIRDGLLLELGAAGEQENKIVDRQNWTQIAGMLQQYYTALLQLAMQTQDQQLAMRIAQKAMAASSEAMRQVAESYDLRNIDRIVMTELINGAREAANALPPGVTPPSIPAIPGIGGSNGVGVPSAGTPMAVDPQIAALLAASGSGSTGLV